jgi:hypothetical protein
MASKVVGTLIQSIPLSIELATKPARSVVAPPPIATIVSFLAIPFSRNDSRIELNTLIFLET